MGQTTARKQNERVREHLHTPDGWIYNEVNDVENYALHIEVSGIRIFTVWDMTMSDDVIACMVDAYFRTIE